jgi:hypothetical protein
MVNGSTAYGDDFTSLVTGTTFATWDEFAATHFIISLDNTGRPNETDIPKVYASEDIKGDYENELSLDAKITVRRNRLPDLTAERIAYLTIDGQGNMYNSNAETSNLDATDIDWQEDVFAKIQLSSSVGTDVFNSFISNPKVYTDAPLRELTELSITIRTETGELYSFFGRDYSFTLAIEEMIDIADDNVGYSTHRGLTDNIILF